MNLENLTKGERFIIEWQYHISGSFKQALLTAITRADQNNQAKLALGFPEEVEAYQKFAYEDDWWKKIQEKAGIKE